MKHFILGSILILASLAAHAGLARMSLLDETHIDTYREGWPPDFRTTLADHALRGPVKCVTTRDVKAPGNDAATNESPDTVETLCFDRQGRMESAALDDFITRRTRLEYDGGKLARMTTRYESGELGTSQFKYDAKGYLVRATQNNTWDIAQATKFRAREFPDEAKKAVRPEPLRVTELRFEYDANGFIARVSCEAISSDRSCTDEDQELTFDALGRPKKLVAPQSMDLFTALKLTGPINHEMPRARLEVTYRHDRQARTTASSSFRNGQPLSESMQFADEYGNVEIQMRLLIGSETVDTRYRHEFDSRQNWTRRVGRDDKTDEQVSLLVREITYWD